MENKNFAVKLKKLRIEKEISQQDLARLIGVAASTVGMYEQGRRTPNYSIIIKICHVLSTTPDYLFGFDNEFTNINEIFSIFINTLSSKEKLDISGEILSQDDRESLILSFNIAFKVWKKLISFN